MRALRTQVEGSANGHGKVGVYVLVILLLSLDAASNLDIKIMIKEGWYEDNDKKGSYEDNDEIMMIR